MHHRVISLSSRKNLCVNEEVLRLGSDGRISDRCLDMQKGKAKVAAAAASPTLSEDKEPQEKRTDAQALKRQRVQRNSTTTEAKKCPFLQVIYLPLHQFLYSLDNYSINNNHNNNSIYDNHNDDF